MAATASASATQSPAGPGVADLEDSNVSSPLSEVDDGDANDDDIEHMQLDSRGDDGDNSSASGDERPDPRHDGSDSDSALSDAASDVHSDGNDTEAETERLYDTPKNQRQRDVLVDQFNNGQVFEHTPSKLRRTTRAVGDNADDESASGDEASVISSHAAGDESPAKPATTNDTSVDEDLKRDSLERKRKRSPVADQSESDQPLRKRTGSVAAADVDADEDLPMNEDDTASAIPASGQQSGGEDESVPASRRDTTVERETRPVKKSTRSSLKRKGHSADDTTGEADSDARDEHADATAGDETEQPEEEADADVDEEADAAAKNIEEMERKTAAFKDWTHIEEMFSIFRERLYKDRLRRLEEEEQSLLADEPTHPEYLNMKKCIDDRLNKRIQEINTEFEYCMKAHERRAIAQRAQIWSQFYQAIREKRELALEKLNQQWYEVQSARRKAHSLPDYGLLFPKDPTQRVRNAIAYNTEVSTLAGLAKYEGFPSGPELRGASTTEVDADFSAIEQVRRNRSRPPPPPPPVQAREDYHHGPPNFSRLGPAGEQFIKDTPWANPNHSAHKQHQQTPAPPGSKSEPSHGVGPAAQAPNGPPPADVKAAFDGQAVARRSPALPGRISESPEMARSKLNPAAHPMKRVGSIPNLGRGPKTAAA
ncbi:Sds3-like protein [Purpureocillium lavendulum]|uniref:Sds3-like protein n=1 Tax=Purpureocillium lavendulum TaxID=1247861 RepID=A0AB34G5W1_9HYPO|nr:Sds3-like protein [Purpureocillium lavendulum]